MFEGFSDCDPFLSILFKHFLCKVNTTLRASFVHSRDVHYRVFLLDLAENPALVGASKRQFFRDHVVEHDAARPDVYRVVVTFLLQHLGG